MKQIERVRAAIAVAGLAVSPAALADAGSSVSSAGWWSVLGVVGVAGVLFLVHKKLT